MPPKIITTKQRGKKKRKTRAQIAWERETGFSALCGDYNLGPYPEVEDADKEGEWVDEDAAPPPPYRSPQKKSSTSNKRGAVSTPHSYTARFPPGRVQSSRKILDAAHGRLGTGVEGNAEGSTLAELVMLDFDIHATE